MLRHTLLVLGLATLAWAGLPPGRPLPDVPISQPGGKKLDLKQYRGKALVVALISLVWILWWLFVDIQHLVLLLQAQDFF